jgi:alkyl sulfatase BDS1-like metallo-beta-lactamase superfamily hydrolase
MKRFLATSASIALMGCGAAVANEASVYMGAPVTIVTLPNGVRMNAEQRGGALGEQAKGVMEVADGIWSLTGYSVVNIYALRGPDGLVIVDTGVTAGEAREALTALRSKTDLPVKAIIYTHKHYMSGAGVFAEGQAVTVVGHPADRSLNVLRGAFPETLPVQFGRGTQQMGGLLPAFGADSAVGDHPGSAGRESLPLTINKPAVDGSEAALAGIRMQFFSANASDDDSVTIWLPDRRIVLNNFYWPVAANLYAPRGDAFRDVRSWIGGLKAVARLRPVLMLSTHAGPVAGEQRIQETLQHYINYHQILLDQTLRGILNGVGPSDIGDFVQFPAGYADIRSGYGETARWYPQSIYNEAFGWYSGDAADLNPVSAHFRHKELTRLLGGAKTVLGLAEAAEARGQYAWALELTNHVFQSEPQNAAARSMKAELLRKHAELTPASIAHNFYIAQARALEGKGGAPLRMYDSASVASTPACVLIDQFRVRVIPNRTANLDGLLAFQVAGEKECGLHVRDGFAEFVSNIDAATATPVAHIILARPQLDDLFMGKVSLVQLANDSTVSVNGDRAAATRLASVFEVLGAD